MIYELYDTKLKFTCVWRIWGKIYANRIWHWIICMTCMHDSMSHMMGHMDHTHGSNISMIWMHDWYRCIGCDPPVAADPRTTQCDPRATNRDPPSATHWARGRERGRSGTRSGNVMIRSVLRSSKLMLCFVDCFVFQNYANARIAIIAILHLHAGQDSSFCNKDSNAIQDARIPNWIQTSIKIVNGPIRTRRWHNLSRSVAIFALTHV